MGEIVIFLLCWLGLDLTILAVWVGCALFEQHGRSVDRVFFLGDDDTIVEVPSEWCEQACELVDLPVGEPLAW